MAQFDLMIRDAKIVDGTGAPPFYGSVGVRDGVIAEIGADLSGAAREHIDAEGRLLTPGFVDIHTHYDGQVTWDDALEPSFSHGTTTVVTGNCGVGFAPVRPNAHRQLIELMEGVEDIPGAALWEGIKWEWETFPQYMDALASRRWSMDVAVQAPHGPIRAYVMGERGVRNEAANEDDIAEMARIVAEAIRAGAVGFSTSRFFGHQALDGSPVPGTFAEEDELLAIGRAIGETGGVFQLIPGGAVGAAGVPSTGERSIAFEIDWMSRLSRTQQLTITYLISEHGGNPDAWRQALNLTDAANSLGARIHPQTGSRPVGILLGLQLRHLFVRRPTYMKLADLPLDQRVAELRKPDVRRAILSEDNAPPASDSAADNMHLVIAQALDGGIFPLGEPVNYEPHPDEAVSAQARRLGVSAEERFYDLMLEQDGRAIMFHPILNYVNRNFDTLHTLLDHPSTIVALGDGGAHCGMICDSSATTHLLTHWARDRSRGPRLPLERVVAKQTGDTAALYGFADRGVIAPGKRADLNVIDFDKLALRAPHAVHDLPAGGLRVLQDARGYAATIVRGVVTRRDDADTGERPGRLYRKPPLSAGAR